MSETNEKTQTINTLTHELHNNPRTEIMIRASAIKKNARRKLYKKNGKRYLVKFIRVFEETEESIELIETDNSNTIKVIYRHIEPQSEAEINILQNL